MRLYPYLETTLPPRGAAPWPTVTAVTRRLDHHVGGLRRQRYRRPSLLMSWLQSFDDVTFAHCVRVAELSFRLGETLELERAALRRVERAALIHDAGKLCVPLEVLNKDAALSPDEWVVMCEHPAAGATICFEATCDRELAALVRQHHERLDGSGYPDRLRAADISLSVRILQLADIYDALTSERPYKAAYTSARARAIIDDEVARGWRDADVAAALHSLVD